MYSRVGNVCPGWPVNGVKYLCYNEGGRRATPTSISIFDFHDMKTLLFEFGNYIVYLYWFQNANTLNLEVLDFIT